MNRNRPPMPIPAPGFQDSPFGGGGGGGGYPQQPQSRYAPPQEAVGIYGPSRVLMALIRLSEKLYPFFCDSLTRYKEGASSLQMDCQNMGIALANRGEREALEPFSVADEIMRIETQKHLAVIEAAVRSELALQGNFKRWVSGQMPVPSAPSAYTSAVPRQPQDGRGYPQPQVQPQQGFAPPPPGAGGQQPPMGASPAIPQGPVDYRDPRQAAEALLRAAPMPMVPQQGQPQMMQQPMPAMPQGAPPFPYPYPQQPMPVQQVSGIPQQQQQHAVAGQPMAMPVDPSLVPTSMQYQHETLPAQHAAPAQQAQQSTNGAAKTS